MTSSSLEHHQITTNGVTLHVVQAGSKDGPVAILLHGFPECWLAWAKQIDNLVTAGFRVWIPDQRGYNTSDKPQDIQSYDMDVLIADICGLIDATGKERVVLCGHDWGGAVAWQLANKHPEKLSHLVIVNAPHPDILRRQLKSSLAQLMKTWYMLFFRLPKLPEYVLRRNNFRALAGSLRGSSRHGCFSKTEIENYRQAWRQPGALTAMLNWYRALFQTKPSAARPNITAPTLLIWGAKDHYFRRELASICIEVCDKGTLKWIEEAGHWVLHEEPEKVGALLQEFLVEANQQVCDAM
jgi:pimeloyl-ACP methyl ester carboxylesterase